MLAAPTHDLFGNPVDEVEPPAEVIARAERACSGPMVRRGSTEWRRAFRITGPATISVSGGRTSAFLLHEILEAHGGQLPPDVHATFANTGRELPATLNFVERCGREWGVPIHWLEYRRDPDTGRVWTEVVGHNSASRDGLPFRMMLEAKQMLPNPVTRFCTVELKIRTMKRWMQTEVGCRRWTNFVGLRADEVGRTVRMGRRNAARKEPFRASAPLTRARVRERDVLGFWAAQPFDLQLRGKWEGNCDGCFLKGMGSLLRMIEDHPERIEAWAKDEEAIEVRWAGVAGGQGHAYSPRMHRYHANRPSVRNLIRYVAENPAIAGARTDPARNSKCGADMACSGGCGI